MLSINPHFTACSRRAFSIQSLIFKNKMEEHPFIRKTKEEYF